MKVNQLMSSSSVSHIDPRLWVRLLAHGLVAACLFSNLMAAYAGPYGATQCAASRSGGNLGCSANDVSINSITVAGTPPAYCVGGQTIPLDLNVSVQFGSSSRYNIGVFIANDGKTPQLLPASGGASSCSVGILPLTSPFSNFDANLCGDGGGGVLGTFVMPQVAVPCTTNGSGSITLYTPWLISWDQNAGTPTSCLDNTYPVPGNNAKCNVGNVTFPAGFSIVVLPAISITDGVTTVRSGGALTYTVVITNTTASPLAAGVVFTDPAVANLSISSVSCVAAGGATCPASPTVAAMQGAGITLPAMPNNSTLTFTITGSYTGTPISPTTLTNAATVSVSGYPSPASDTDTVMVPPAVTKSFSPSAIASGGTSTLTITLTNPTATVNITSAAFTDSYPAGMTNWTTPSPSSSNCGSPTITATAGGGSLTVSGATIASGTPCTVTVKVTATTTGVNSTGAVTSGNAATGSAASGTLSVVSATPSTVVANPTSVANDGVSTSTITVTLKDTAGNPVPGKTITLTAGSGSSTITTVSGVTDVNGQATFTVKDAVQEAVTYTAKDTTDNITIAQTATVTFSSVNSFNAFETSTAPNTVITGPIYTKLAGTAFGLDVVAIAGASKANGFSGNVKVELLANTGTPGSGYGANNCPTSNSVIQTIASTAIAGGRSTVNFAAVASAYRDVRARISYPTTSPTITICSTDSFAIRPAAFTITSSNAANTGTSGSPAIKAGANFNLTATAVTGYDGTPSLDATQVVGTSTAGTLSGSFGVATSGVATGNAFTYSEVGNFGLNANAVYDTTFTNVDPSSDCTNDFSNALVGGKYGCKIGSNAVAQTTGSSGFGRFIPDHFDTAVVATATVPMPCPAGLTCPTLYNGFVYSGQSFTTQVYARNLAGTTTLNYDSARGYSKAVTLTVWDAVGSVVTSNPGGGTLTSTVVPSTAFNLGVTTTPAPTPIYTFPTSPVAPTKIYVRATDGDSVTSLQAISVEGGVMVVSGRVKIGNAYGSELLLLPMTVTVQYNKDGTASGWVTSTTDSATSFNTSTNIVVAIIKGPLASVSVASAGAVNVTSGVKTFTLNVPGITGSANISLNAPSYLLTGSNGAAVNPSVAGLATFGVYKGSNNFIYMRENY